MELCLDQSQDNLPGKGFRMRQAQYGRNGKGEVTGRKGAGTRIFYLQAALLQVEHHLLILPTTGENKAML